MTSAVTAGPGRLSCQESVEAPWAPEWEGLWTPGRVPTDRRLGPASTVPSVSVGFCWEMNSPGARLDITMLLLFEIQFFVQ